MKTYRYSLKLKRGLYWDTLSNDYVFCLNQLLLIICVKFRKIKTSNRYKVRIVHNKKIHCFQNYV